MVEFADGIIQRETSLLLLSEEVQSRNHRLIFCANEAFGAIGGLKILDENYSERDYVVDFDFLTVLQPQSLYDLCCELP